MRNTVAGMLCFCTYSSAAGLLVLPSSIVMKKTGSFVLTWKVRLIFLLELAGTGLGLSDPLGDPVGSSVGRSDSPYGVGGVVFVP